jgi:hypothetical protein
MSWSQLESEPSTYFNGTSFDRTFPFWVKILVPIRGNDEPEIVTAKNVEQVVRLVRRPIRIDKVLVVLKLAVLHDRRSMEVEFTEIVD